MELIAVFLRRAFARRCEGLFRRIPVQEDADVHARQFMRSGYQYYATARFAMHAGCMPVAGNLFHHAVEMILKGGLAPKHKLSDLNDKRHNLKELWEAYKADFPDDPTLKRHDKTISGLNKFEDIRYPDANQHAMGVTLGWCGPAGEVTTYGRMKTPKRYTLLVSEIDDLIVDAFKMSNWNPVDPVAFMGTNSAAREVITRCNAHSEFLTTGRG